LPMAQRSRGWPADWLLPLVSDWAGLLVLLVLVLGCAACRQLGRSDQGLARWAGSR